MSNYWRITQTIALSSATGKIQINIVINAKIVYSIKSTGKSCTVRNFLVKLKYKVSSIKIHVIKKNSWIKSTQKVFIDCVLVIVLLQLYS